MRKINNISIILSSLIVFHFQSEAQLLDTISKNHYYEKEIFDEQYLDIYKSWMLKDISGGFSGEGYDADFDRMIIDSIGIFKTYRNDSLFIYGKITVVTQTDEQLLISFDADTVSGGIFFDDMYKYIDIRNDTLMLMAPCCDRYNYLFIRENQIVYIPDTAFLHALIDEGVDSNGDSLVSYAEAEACNYLSVSGTMFDPGNISDMTGIEAFINLDSLSCGYNRFSSIDVSANTSLKKLEIDSYYSPGQLSSLDLTKNASLETLVVIDHELKNIDLSYNIFLKYLNCVRNGLTNLDLSQNIELKTLICSGNYFTCLDLSNNIELTDLSVGWWSTGFPGTGIPPSPLTRLDISGCTKLQKINMNGMPHLVEGCVWKLPFPPYDIEFNGWDSKFRWQSDCNWICDDNQPPTIIAPDSLYQPDSIKVISSEDGWIFLVPENTERYILWIRMDCIDSVYAISNNPVYIPLAGLGNGIYWLYASDSSWNISESIAFTITGVIEVGIDEIKSEWERIYPNPTNNLITIKTSQPGQHFIDITSLNGQLLYTDKIEGPTNQIDLSSFQKGLYFITIRTRNYVRTEKIIKQ